MKTRTFFIIALAVMVVFASGAAWAAPTSVVWVDDNFTSATDGWDAGDAGFGSELRGADRSADWPWQLRNCVRSVAQLERALKLVKPEREGVQAAERAGFPLRVTPNYLSLCNQYDERCPLRRQVVPHIHETHEVRGDLSDPLGEEAHEVAPRLIRR